jgi:hypothetical protein
MLGGSVDGADVQSDKVTYHGLGREEVKLQTIRGVAGSTKISKPIVSTTPSNTIPLGPRQNHKRPALTTLACTISPSLKHSPIRILSLSVNLISAILMTPVKSSLDSGTGRLFDIVMVKWACWGAKRVIVPMT